MPTLPRFPRQTQKLWQSTLADHASILSLLSPLGARPYQLLKKEFDQCKSWESFLAVLGKLEQVQNQERELLLPLAHDYEKYLSLLRHMQMEQYTVPRMIQGKCSLAEEIDFILHEASQHTDLIGQVLLQLSERAHNLTSEAKDYDFDLLDFLDSANQIALDSISPIVRKLTLHELTESLLGLKRLLQLAEAGMLSIPPAVLEKKISFLQTALFYYQQ